MWGTGDDVEGGGCTSVLRGPTGCAATAVWT